MVSVEHTKKKEIQRVIMVCRVSTLRKAKRFEYDKIRIDESIVYNQIQSRYRTGLIIFRSDDEYNREGVAEK